MDEVRQTARIALVDAARTFDPTRGVPFGPYSSIVVRNRLNALYRRENLRRERIPQSLDEPLPGDFDETRQDYTPDTKTPDAPTMASRNEAKMLIDGLIATLPERMRVAVEGYLQQRQQEEIGGAFGISKQAVSKLQQEGFKRLRQKLNERGIGSVTEILSAARKNPMTGTIAESMGEYGISASLPLNAEGGMGSIGNRPSAQPLPNTAPVRSLDHGQTRIGIPAEDAFSKISYAPARVWGVRRLAERFKTLRNSVGGYPIQAPIYRADYDAHQAAFREAAQAAERLYRETLNSVDAANASRKGTADYLLPRLPEVRKLFTDANGQVQLLDSRPAQLELGEALFAASGTPQDDGDFIAPSDERGIGSVNEFLSAARTQTSTTTQEDQEYLRLAQDPKANRQDLLKMVDERAISKTPTQSITPEAEKLQKMADDKARSVGYNAGYLYHGTKGKDKKYAKMVQDAENATTAWPVDSPGGYEGTRAGDFTKFKSNTGLFFFSPSKDFAQQFMKNWDGKGVGRLIKVHLWAQNTFDFENSAHMEKIGEQPGSIKSGGFAWRQLETPEFLEKIKNAGYDSMFVVEQKDIGEHDYNNTVKNLAVFAPWQIKVADPVTYDRRGNIIPLSQRFNPANDSILYAASGTPQDDGDFIAPGESFESDLENLLNDLNGVPADIDNAVAKQEQAALEEGGGQRYQVGRPDLAFGANNPDVRGLDQFYTDRFLPETEAQWETSARDMVSKDFEGTRRSIEQAGLSGQAISPELTKAADQIANTLRQKMLQTGKDEDRKAFNVFWYSYRATGTEAGRALASRRDPFKTPAMRHRDFLMDLMFTPGKKDKEKIDAEKDPAKKTALIDSVTAALLKKLKDAGISPEDILGNRVVVGLNNAEIQRQFRTGLTPKQSEVFDLLLRKNQTPAQISQRTGMKPDAVEAIFTAFKNRMRQQHLAKFKAGIHKQSEVTLKAAPTQTGLFGGQVSDAEAEAAFDQWFSGMVGTSDTKKIGRPKFRIDDPAHVMRLARAIQSARSEAGLGDMAYEWWIMNILSGPQTQVSNISGNAGFLALDSTLQRGMEALVNVFVRDKKAARLGEFKSLARGIMPGITKGLAMAAKAWSAEHDFYEHTVLGTPLELGQWDKLGNTRAAIPGQAGRAVRIPGRALLFADSFFKQLSGQMNVAAFAYRIAKAEGLRGQALTDRVAQLSKTRGEIVSENLPSAAPSQEIVEYFARQLARRDASLDPAALIANRSSEAWELAREQAAYDAAKKGGWTEDAWIRAVEKSKEMTFQQDLKRRNEGGSLFEDAAAKLQDARFNNQLIGFFFPFVKTPYNIFRTGIRKSPVGAANLAWQAGKGFLAMNDGKPFLDGDPTLVRDLSEQLIAWTAMALIFGAVQGDDDDDDKMLLITGSQPRSEATAGLRDLNSRATGGEYMIRIGGRNGITIPYGRFDPIATVLGTTTDLIRSIKRNGSTTENLASLWNYMVAQTNSKTFLQGLANISTILEGKSDPVGATKRTVLQALVPNIIRQPLRNLDDYVRDTKTAPATYTLLPTGDLAEPKVDVYGNEIRKGSSPVMRLFFNSALATEPVLEATDNLLMNWNRSNPSMAYAPEQAKAVYKSRNGKEVDMTAEETRRFRLASGRLASVKLRAVATPARVANPTEDDIQAIRNAFSEARRETRERMFAGR